MNFGTQTYILTVRTCWVLTPGHFLGTLGMFKPLKKIWPGDTFIVTQAQKGSKRGHISISFIRSPFVEIFQGICRENILKYLGYTFFDLGYSKGE